MIDTKIIPNVKLVSYTNDPVKIIYQACKTCYSDNRTNIFYTIKTKEEQSDFIYKIVKSGHSSVLEHVLLNFYIDDVDRALTHQLVRHRIGFSYSQRSQRYTKLGDNEGMIIPESIFFNEEAMNIFNNCTDNIRYSYNELLDLNIPKEDARSILPNATPSSIFTSANIRALYHFFNLRTCKRAQSPIRLLSFMMISEIYRNDDLKLLFPYDLIGPSCISYGKCRETKSCGDPYLEISQFKY
jgi:thymidylate synthase (FAD)